MLITTPENIDNVLFSGHLDLHATGAGTRGVVGSEIREVVPERPLITVGEPQYWNVARVYKDEAKPTPAVMRQMLADSDFFLVRFACSFNLKTSMNVDWARFEVALSSRRPETAQPICFDLYPMEVYEEQQREVSVKISPSLKFADTVEASLGEAALEVKYNKLVPVITALGIQEPIFSWEMRQTGEYPVRGARWFTALLKVPRDAQGVDCAINIVLHVATPRRLFLGSVRQQDQAKLRRVICT
jgi:hypothetical protein